MENTRRYSARPELIQRLLNLHAPCERRPPVNRVPVIYKRHSYNAFNLLSIFTVMGCNEKSDKIHINSTDLRNRCITNL